MSLQENRQLVQRFWEEVWSQGNLTLVDEMVTPDFVLYTPQGRKQGPEGLKQWVAAIRNAAPDIRFTVEKIIAEDEQVATSWSGNGTNTGPFLGNPPSGKPITMTGMSIFEIEEKRIRAEWLTEHIA
jgi:steroid delta-isomerase-like uncharacterized protein